MRLTEAIKGFLEDRKLTLGKATLAAYDSDLSRMAAFASQNTVLAFTPDLVRVYLHSVSAQGRRMSTLHRKMSAIGELGKWGVKRRLWPTNPVEELERIKRPKHLPRPFSRAQVDALCALELPPAERALRALLFLTGLRVTPICTLKLGDVSFEPPTLRAWVKGAKVQVIQMPTVLRDLLLNYTLSQSDLKGQSPLISFRGGRPTNRKHVERVTHRWGQVAGVPDCTPHRFRHTFGTELLRITGNLRVVQEALGHADVSSTQIYTEVTGQMQADAVEKLPWKLT